MDDTPANLATSYIATLTKNGTQESRAIVVTVVEEPPGWVNLDAVVVSTTGRMSIDKRAAFASALELAALMFPSPHPAVRLATIEAPKGHYLRFVELSGRRCVQIVTVDNVREKSFYADLLPGLEMIGMERMDCDDLSRFDSFWSILYQRKRDPMTAPKPCDMFPRPAMRDRA